LKVGSLDFTPGPWPTIGAVAMIALTLWLGHWQTERGDQKQALQSLLEARTRQPVLMLRGPVASAEDVLFRRVVARGEFVPGGQFFVDNQVFEGRAGFHAVAPLRLAGSDWVVLVDRGWIERTSVEASGIAWLPPLRYLELSSDTVAGDVWQNLSVSRYAERTKQPLLPFVLLADVAQAPLTVVQEHPDTGIERHREYALTWYSLAATTLALWIALNVRRVR